MDFTLELVCPARGSFSLSTKVLSVHVTGNQLSEKAKPFPSTISFINEFNRNEKKRPSKTTEFFHAESSVICLESK